MESVYGDNEVGSDGLTNRQRKFQEECAAYDRMVDDTIMKQVESIGIHDRSDDQPQQPAAAEIPQRRVQERQRVAAGKNYSSGVSTGRARDAAKALSGNERTAPRSRAAPITRPKARIASSLFPSKKPRGPTNPSYMRHTAAAADSRTTVGYNKGREVSSRLHGNTKTSTKEPAATRALSPETYTRPESSVDSENGTLQDELPAYEEDEETQNFQLTL